MCLRSCRSGTTSLVTFGVRSCHIVISWVHACDQLTVECFDKPRRLASSIIESILSAPTIQNESTVSLNKFLSTFDENIAFLETLDVQNSLAFLTPPVSSRRIFRTTNEEAYPKAQDLFKFVKNWQEEIPL